MKKVVFFTPSLNIGGIERVFMTYSEGLMRIGFDVSYLICHDNGDLLSVITKELRVVSLGNIKLTKSLVPLIRFFKENTVDYFITGGDIPNALALIASKLAHVNTKIIISQHNYLNIEGKNLLSKMLIRFFYNKASKIISVSDGITDMLINSGVSKEKIATIYNPVNQQAIRDLGNLNVDSNLPSNYLLYIGRLGVVKNLPLLLDSYKLIEERYPSLELVLVGDGPMRGMLENKSQELGLSDKIHFMGVLSNPYPLIRRAAEVILCSFSEALPTVILESFVFGKTIVSSPTMGAVDLLENGRLGYISDSFDNAEHFASIIEKGLSVPISVDILETKVKDFSIDFKLKELQNLFLNIDNLQ